MEQQQQQQQVYPSSYGIRLIHQNPDEQQQQANYIMASHQDNSNQILIADESTGQHIVSHLQQQQQQPQYIQQDDGNQYLIQQQSPAPQQVFYANIQQSPQNISRIIHQQQPQGGNLMQQQTPQKHVVLQAQPKVIIQRNSDMMQSNPPPLVDQHNQQIQYSFQPQPQQHMDQGQQIIIQQQSPQMKQTLYQHQTGQIVNQPQYIQLTPQGTKLITQGTPIRYSIVARPQQINSPQQTQMMQVQQQSPDQQGQIRAFRPRVITTQMRIARPNSPHLQQIQMQQNRPRTPQRMVVPRLVRPAVQQNQQQCHTPQPQTQQIQRIIQPTGTRMAINNGQQFYLIQQQDGQQIMVAAPQNHQPNMSSPPQLVRTSQAQVVQSPQPPQPQQQNVQTNSEEHAPTTSTLPKKDGDCDDLEDSITATAISKSAQAQSNENFRRLPAAAPQRVGIVRPLNRPPMPRNNALQIIRQRPPHRPIQPGGLNHALGVRERESAKMLVILDNGEQRLITFTLPKETCTVQELLDQVGIEVGADSNIECIENPSPEIDYIVKVGRFASREDTIEMTKAAENHIRQQAAQAQQAQRMVQRTSQSAQPEHDAKTPETPKSLPPKFVEGHVAVCGACGFSGADHAKCERCGRVFTNEVKSIRLQHKNIMTNRITVTKTPNERKDQLEAIQKKHQLATGSKQIVVSRRLPTTPVTMYPSNMQVKNRPRNPRAKPVAPEIVTLSSDDEDSSESKASIKNGAEKKFQINVAMRKPFEPEIFDDKVEETFERVNVLEFNDGEEKLTTSFTCRSIRIGSYKFDSTEKVDVTNKGIRIVAPSVKDKNDKIVLSIQHSEIVKMITHFSKQLQIIFIYTKPSCARYIVEQLSMTLVNDKSPYFAPLSLNDTQKKIVLLIDNATDENKQVLRSIYPATQLEDITNRDANELLVRSNGITVNSPNVSLNSSAVNDAGIMSNGDYKKLITYPEGRGGIPITTYDYLCLGTDNYLNDVIIDFYLKYIHHDLITPEQREKSHIFSQFFYKRLTTMNKEKDNRTQTAAQKRHARVAGWTKNVNIFEKDFIIIPINEQSHWFLAIICFPNLTEPRTMDTDQPIKLAPAVKRTQKKAVKIGDTTITPLKKEELSIELKDDGSERDEAEGDESELSNAADSDEEEVVDKGQAVKVPCVLIFDSLGGASRAKVVATLRDYLACEYKVKYPDQPPRVYNKTSMVGSIVKVPQQQNFTDCGLFLLQYVEHFFSDPIKDFRPPIKSVQKWFSTDIVTKKREDISNLIKNLMEKQGVKDVELPKIDFPTLNGQLIEQQSTDTLENSNVEDAFGDEAAGDEEYKPTEEELKEADTPTPQKRVYVSKKRSLDNNTSDNGNAESGAKTNKRNKTN